MKKKHYQSLGIGLFSSLLLFVVPHALAEETTNTTIADPIGTPPDATIHPPTNSSYTDNSQLNQAISQATAEGILTVQTETETVETEQEAQDNYAQQEETVIEVTKQYQKAKLEYQKAEEDYQNYQKQVQNYQKQLAQYQDYQKKEQHYQVELKTYHLAKARYDEDYQEALRNTDKIGYLPEVLAQNLIFRSEPNATQTFTGNVIPDDVLKTVIKNSLGWMDPGTVTANLVTQTVTTKGRWNSALMSIGDTVVVDYSDLENSSFSNHQLKKVRYTYKLLSTTHYSGKVIFQAIADPTVTSYTHIYNKDGKTQGSFEMEMAVQFFDANGKELIPSAEQYALTSFASINSLNGQGEFVGKYNGTFIPINGSTISVQNDYALNHSDIPQESLASHWDSETSPEAYIGAIVGKSTDRIRFTFGNSDGFADWFAFNSDVKVKGGILKPPTPPVAPPLMKKPILPKEVTEPQAILTPIILYHHNKVVPKPKPLSPRTTKLLPQKAKPSQKVNITPVYHRPVLPIPVIYTYAKPISPTRIIHPTYSSPHSAESATKRKQATKQEKPVPKKKTSSSQKDWFGINTGIKNSLKAGAQQTDLINFIKEVGKKAKKKHGNNQAAINRDIALTLASPSYHRDFLQNLYSTYKGSTYKVPNSIKKTITKNHEDGKIDFAHVMTTLASLEQQKLPDETTKYFASRSLLFPSLLTPNPIIETINNLNYRNTILQQNSFIGDLLTSMPESDIYTDMDAIILARHPNYKDLPLDKRILKYYGQKHLDSKRKELFLEVYGKNRGKDKGEAQLGSFKEIVLGLLTLGGAGALTYSVAKGKHKNIGKNIKKLDTVLYDGNINKFLKHPIKTTGLFIAKSVDKKVIKPATKVIRKISSKIKPVITGAKKVFTKTKHFVTKTIPKTIRKEVIKKINTIVKRVIPKPVRRVIKKVVKPVIRPIKRGIKRITSSFKKVFRTVKRAVTPRKRISRKRRR